MSIFTSFLARCDDAKRGFLTRPATADWRAIAPIFLAHVALGLTVITCSDALKWHGIKHGPLKSGLFILPLMMNAVVEEVVFRGMLIPHKSSAASKTSVYAGCALSVILYTAWHPFGAYVIMGFREHAFLKPMVLVIVASLGGACAAAYRKTGSLWPPVAIHCLTTAIWALGFL